MLVPDLNLAAEILDRVPAMVAIIDGEGCIRLWNRGAEELTGRSAASTVGQSLEQVFPSALRSLAAQVLAGALAGRSWEGEVETPRPDNPGAPVFYRCSPLRGPEGSIVGLIATGVDLTERRRTEAALRESEERLRGTLQSMPVLLDAFDAVGVPLAWNAECERVTGWSAAEMIGNPRAMELLYPTPAERHRVVDALRSGSGNVLGFEAEITRKDGTRRIISWANVSERFPLPGWATWAMGTDVTEQRRTERDYRAAIETALDGFAIVDREGRVLDANEAFSRMLGFDRDELRGRSVFDLEVRDRATDASRQATIERNRARLETRYRRKDDRIIDVEISVSNGDPGGGRFFMFLRDVTEHRRLEEQYRQAQKMEAVGRLAGGVAHDFNNLLTAIAGYSELVLRSLPDGDDRRLDIEEIKRAGERATALTRQLLAFSRKQVLRPKVIDLNSVVVDVEKMLRRLIGEDIKMATQLDAASRVKADPSQVEQVLMNLAINARDAMPDGGTLRIATSEERLDAESARDHSGAQPGLYVVLEVSDTGTGMDEATSSHLFEPFFTTKEKGKGTGLGLATVYGVVRQSGGHIVVDTALGRGTTFRIYLPATSSDEPREVARVAVHSPSPRGHETVLLVEDETNVRAFAARVLREQGYRVIEASDGAEALSIARRAPSPIQVLVTDVVMPHMNGRALVAELRRDQPHIPVLYISGYTPDDIAERGVEETEATMLPKPFTPELLVRKVRELLDDAALKATGQAPTVAVETT